MIKLRTDLLPDKQVLTEAKHFMTPEEERVKFEICKLLVQNNHRKYAERLADPALSLNLVDSEKDPSFIAAISFEEATIFISDGFVKGGPGIFKQLDTVMRHELAHNLMMHQIRMMHVFKNKHRADGDDPEEAYEQIKFSWNLHTLLNWIEDFEISNERYSNEDKRIARQLELNGRVIHGLVTEDHRAGWVDMPLEEMYKQLADELEQVNDKIRNDPNWSPKDPVTGKVDGLAATSASMISTYFNPDAPSNLSAYSKNGITLQDIENETGDFKDFPEVIKRLAKVFYEAFKDFNTSDDRIEKVEEILKRIAATKPDEKITINHPDTGTKVATLYTADFKALISDILKKIIEKPIKLDPAFVDAWTKVMQIVAPENPSDNEIDAIIEALGGDASNILF